MISDSNQQSNIYNFQKTEQKYKSYDKNIYLALKKIISNDSIWYDENGIRKVQNQEIKKVFTNSNGYYDKRKKNAYLKFLLENNNIKRDERYLSFYLDTNISTYKIKIDPIPNSFVKYHFKIKMPNLIKTNLIRFRRKKNI
jgi:hypothetical protein